jgi:predicted ArsR family transcriptional regulator
MPGEQGVRPSAEMSARWRVWIGANAAKMTNREMALHLNISPQSVRDHLYALGMAIRSSRRGRPRKKVA